MRKEERAWEIRMQKGEVRDSSKVGTCKGKEKRQRGKGVIICPHSLAHWVCHECFTAHFVFYVLWLKIGPFEELSRYSSGWRCMMLRPYNTSMWVDERHKLHYVSLAMIVDICASVCIIIYSNVLIFMCTKIGFKLCAFMHPRAF